MNTEDILEIIRERVGQVVQEIGGDPPTYPDEFLIKYVKTAVFHLTVLGIVVGATVDTTNVILVPDSVALPIGMLIGSFASASVISDDILKRLRSGELGLSFNSGATAISTNQAAINLKAAADSLKSWHSLLLTAYLSGDPNSVLSRTEGTNEPSTLL